MLDPRRAGLLASMGINEWQLRHPELLALQGQLSAVDAEPEVAPQVMLPGLCIGASDRPG